VSRFDGDTKPVPQSVVHMESLLALHKSLTSTQNPQEADRLTREVESVDKSIDELYGLSQEEIKIVEGVK